jgi:hypothetical protein
LEVFDPEGLPAGLSNKAAAEQARFQRLPVSSPRLLALLTHIRQWPTGITVNVVGGQNQQPVVWVAGDPPRVEGAGATCALWTLILPVEEDVQELQRAVPQIEAWAKALGLRVFDEVQEACAQQGPKPAAVAATVPVVDGEELPGPSDILILNWGARCVTEYVGHPHYLKMRQFVQRCMARDKLAEINRTSSVQRQTYPEADVQRLLQRLLEFFPFEAYGQSHWCGRHPVTEPLCKRPGLRLIRVAPEHRTEVLKRLIPLSRELFLTVVLHDREFFVERSRFEKDYKAQREFMLWDLDVNWTKVRLTPKQREKQLCHALTDALAPHGFEHQPDKVFHNTFVRPLRHGGGLQMIQFGDHLRAHVESDRLSSVQRVVGWNTPPTVVSFDQSLLAEMAEPGACVWEGRSDSPEEIAWAVEDIRQLLLPVLDRLHTAQDLWEWLSQPMTLPSGRFPGFSDLHSLKEWCGIHQNFFALTKRIYAARCLPDEAFQPLLHVWRAAAEAESKLRPDHPGIKNTLKLAEAFEQMPQTPLCAPL